MPNLFQPQCQRCRILEPWPSQRSQGSLSNHPPSRYAGAVQALISQLVGTPTFKAAAAYLQSQGSASLLLPYFAPSLMIEPKLKASMQARAPSTNSGSPSSRARGAFWVRPSSPSAAIPSALCECWAQGRRLWRACSGARRTWAPTPAPPSGLWACTAGAGWRTWRAPGPSTTTAGSSGRPRTGFAPHFISHCSSDHPSYVALFEAPGSLGPVRLGQLRLRPELLLPG